MAQVTGQTTGASFYAAVSTDGSSYTDVSGAATLVEPKATQRKHGEAYTGGSEDYPALARITRRWRMASWRPRSGS